MPDRINHLAVWVAAIAFFFWGAIWYMFLFGNAWRALAGNPPMASVATFIESFVLGLILAYATAMALTRRAEDQTLQQGISFAIFMGIGLYATMTLNHIIYEGRSLTLWLINTGYTLIGFVIIAAIVGAWKKKGAT
jgi:hypothetical protein